MEKKVVELTMEELKMIIKALQNRQDLLEGLGKNEESDKCFELECKIWEIRKAK